MQVYLYHEGGSLKQKHLNQARKKKELLSCFDHYFELASKDDKFEIIDPGNRSIPIYFRIQLLLRFWPRFLSSDNKSVQVLHHLGYLLILTHAELE